MTSTIATFPAVVEDPASGCWPISDVTDWQAALLGHDFGGGGRIDFLLPRRVQPVDFSDSDAIVNVAPDTAVRWQPFKDHVKADVVFTRKPDTLLLWFAVALTDLDATVHPAGVDLHHDGRLVGVLPRPFLLDGAGTRHDLDWALNEAGDELTCVLPDLDPDLYVGAVFDPTTVDTSIGSQSTAFSNQRKVGVFANGTILAYSQNSSVEGEFHYSTDDGATFTQMASGATIAGVGNCTVFVDQDDYVTVVWKQSGTGGSRTDGKLYLVRGTPNAGRTLITWGTVVDMMTAGGHASYDHPACVAFRHPGSSPTTWHVAVVASFLSGATNRAVYARYTVATDGTTLTFASVDGLSALDSPWGILGGNYSTALATEPSIDFNHTGDGKTVAGAAPSLYVWWTDGTGVAFRKAPYSSGFTWSSERSRSTDGYANAGRISSAFDGTRSVVAFAKSGATTAIAVTERDAGDTTFTARNPPALSDGTVEGVSVSYDAAGNIWLLASAATSQDPKYVKYDRAAGTWGSWTSLAATTVRADSITTRAGAAESRLDIVTTENASAPYSVVFYSVALNAAPNAPTWSTAAGAKDVASNLALAAPFSDPDTGDTPSAYALKRDIGGTVRWWDGTDWDAAVETYVTSTAESWSIPTWGADGDTDHSYYVRYKDAAGLASSYSSALVITPSAKVNPTLDEPDHSDVVGSSTLDAEWTVAEQSAYRVRLLDDAAAELWSTGWVTDSAARRRTIGYTLVNGDDYTVELTTKNAEGLESTADSNDISVSYTPPPVPTLVATAEAGGPGPDDDRIDVTIINPAPGVGEPAFVSNDLYRRETAAGGDGIRIAAGLTEDAVYQDWAVASGVAYEYLVRSFGDNNTSRDSAWTD